MTDNFIFSNDSVNEKDEENNSLFQFNQNLLFQKEDSSNYFKNIVQINEEDEDEISNNEYNSNNFQYNNLGNDFQYKNNEFPENENYLNKDFYLINSMPINEEDSYKILNNNNDALKEEKEEIIFKDGSSSGTGTEDTPSRTGETGMKSQSKDSSLNNSNIASNNCKIFNSNIVTFTEQKINNKKLNNKNDDKKVLSKKRKQRIHLEDLNIDPEIIKYKKYQTIGDKVITSKNSVITDLDKKEIRAIRNRISAQKSRDRKKAEFLNLQMKLKLCQQQIERQNLIIKNFEEITCPVCKSKLNQILLQNTNFPSDQSDIQQENEYLELEENSSILSDKKGSFIGKMTGALIALVCLIGIVFCVAQGGLSLSYKNTLIENNSQLNMRHLESTNDLDINLEQNNNISNITIKDDEEEEEINVPLPINFNNLQLYHDRFGLDIYSFLKNKRKNKGKNGFLMRKSFFNESVIDNSMCIETNNIEHNNYIIDNNFKNTLPVEANNIIIDNKLSHKIISLFVKDYDTLQRYFNGRSLTLEEQIEKEAKNSEDGCVYLQMIIPKYKIKNFGDNDTYERYNGFFEIRGKIFAYNNYYDNKVTPSF